MMNRAKTTEERPAWSRLCSPASYHDNACPCVTAIIRISPLCGLCVGCGREGRANSALSRRFAKTRQAQTSTDSGRAKKLINQPRISGVASQGRAVSPPHLPHVLPGRNRPIRLLQYVTAGRRYRLLSKRRGCESTRSGSSKS